VHGIAIDNQRRLYINDRSNRRIQVFDENGKFLNQWYLGDGPTATYHIYMTADQHLWASDGHGNFKFYKFDLNGKLLYTWGTMTPQQRPVGNAPVRVDQDGNPLHGRMWGGRPQKFIRGRMPTGIADWPTGRAAWTSEAAILGLWEFGHPVAGHIPIRLVGHNVTGAAHAARTGQATIDGAEPMRRVFRNENEISFCDGARRSTSIAEPLRFVEFVRVSLTSLPPVIKSQIHRSRRKSLPPFHGRRHCQRGAYSSARRRIQFKHGFRDD